MTGSGSIRDRFRQQPIEEPEDLSTLEDVEESEPPETYVAYAMGTQGRRGELGLLLYYEDGLTVEVLYYSYIIRVLATSPQSIVLMCTDGVYILNGQNLMPLMRLLREHRVRFLQAFNPQKHPALAANDDATLIHGITMMTNTEWWERYRQREEVRPTEAH